MAIGWEKTILLFLDELHVSIYMYVFTVVVEILFLCFLMVDN